MSREPDLNVVGGELLPCSLEPMTGFYRDGCCGTGPEDASDPRVQGDFGEEYVTSDVWTDFDDEGNAYAMVLDDPGFPDGNGWGMSFHRWESVSRSDLRRGITWSGTRTTADGFASGAALGGASVEVVAGGLVAACSGQRDAVEGGVGVAVTAAVEPAPSGFAG